MLSDDALDGLVALLDDYAGVRPPDVAVLAYTFDSRECAAWVAGALEVRGVDTRLVPMAPLDDAGFAARLAAALPSPADLRGRLLVMVLERGTMSHSAALRDGLADFDAERRVVIRSLSSCPDLFTQALRARPSDLAARNATLLGRFSGARRLRIACSGGTRLDVALDGDRYRWISNRGIGRPGSAIILPAGEVATF
ncbi:MAG: hypothetical protein IT561_03260, partial [Alphaproteobacteria bacterium]|nr:hypothetical protein [Alphaproteobacteria bacterium]